MYSDHLLTQAIRDAVVSSAKQSSIPIEHIDEVCDLGLDMACAAIDTLQRVAMSAGDHRVGMSALGIGTSVLIGVLPNLLAAIEATAVAAGGTFTKQEVSL